jgi:5'-nucleotidase / UDP-sugar diphosphatase
MNFRNVVGAAGLAAATLAGLAATQGCDNEPTSPRLYGPVHFTIIQTADIHSRIFPYDLELGQTDAGLGLGATDTVVNIGGAARVSHVVGRERARASRVLHLDNGDIFEGAPIFNYYSGEPETRMLSAMGTDAMVVANHEFDYGATNLGIQLQRWATFPVLAANYLFVDPSLPGSSPLGSIIRPFTTFDLDGLRVAVIGMGNLSSLGSIFSEPNRLGITPLNTRQTAQFYVDLLRPMVDVVVVLSHLGVDADTDMIQNTTGIDIVLGGHNHIVLQPPKVVPDCSANFDPTYNSGQGSYYISIDTADSPNGQTNRYCSPRNVVLSHSGAFSQFVGRLDFILSNDPTDIGDPNYDPINGFEVISHQYEIIPITEQVPEDPIITALLEPYAEGLEAMTNLQALIGYAPDGALRESTTGGDAPLGNMVAAAMWLRLGVQTDWALTNTEGIRANLYTGPVSLDEMYDVFPFNNTITTLQSSGTEIKETLDYVARRSALRGCVSQAQVAGARIVFNCTEYCNASNCPLDEEGLGPGVATNIYIGTYNPPKPCKSDADCPGGDSSCDPNIAQCWQPISPIASYSLATSNYLASGGSGFVTLQHNTTKMNNGTQQRDALIDYIQSGFPCGADPDGGPHPCSTDADCAVLPATSVGGYVCACPEAVIEGTTCQTDPTKTCDSPKGACVLAQCRDDVAAIEQATCAAASIPGIESQCEGSLTPCLYGGETCKYLACIDRRLGNYSDGRIKMEGQ